MKIIVTGSDRAHLLASLIPKECWESEGVTVTEGPRRGGLETFVFDLPGMHREKASEYIRRVWEEYPPSPEYAWHTSREETPVVVHDIPFDWNAIDADYTSRGL